ncbi:MAG: glycosyltransferase family 2 protein [Gammaproteobacteria bacterium]|nr:glycosyltransferase family 2 protein [Gammaproteobacteria bacterium]
MDKEQLYILIPCLNEENNIEHTVNSLNTLVDQIEDEFECNIIMVDDGSTDNTLQMMEKISSLNPRCTFINNEKNLGMGRSVLNTINVVPRDAWVSVVPGDNEFIADSLKNHLSIRKKYDLILGYVDNDLIRPLTRRLASSAFTNTIQFLYGFHFRYINGFKLYKAHVFQGIHIVSSGHAFNAELIAKAKLRNPYIRIGEAPFLARGRSSGNSKAFSPKSVLKAIIDVARGYKSVNKYREKIITQQEI